MALEIITLADQAAQEVWVADRRLYLNADKTHVVEEGDSAARFLFVSKGRTIPLAQAKALGLVPQPKAPKPPAPEPVEAVVEPEAKEQPKPDDKQVKKPANKARKKAKTK